MKKLLTTLAALTLSTGVQAETIHGACDGLAGTGAAYGLCVAICEVPAEDEGCMPTYIDGVLVEDSLNDCRPASMKLIEKFQDKAPAGTELPCGDYTSSVACPFPDPDFTPGEVTSCFPRPDGGGGVNGPFPSAFTLANLITRGWTCRTVLSDGSRTILPVPGIQGEGTELDACLGVFNSLCP